MTPFAVAGVQMYVNALRPNVETVLHRLDILMARFPWTQMVLCSDLAPFGPLPRYALPFPNESLERFQAAARQHNTWLIPGSMSEKAGGEHVYNTSAAINPKGHIATRYRKMFPFRPMRPALRRAPSSTSSTSPMSAASGFRSAMTCGFPRPRAS